MRIMSNRISIVLLCALFNLLFEYSARGVVEFISRPLFILSLFGIYFTYFLVLEDLIVRFKLNNLQIFIVAFLYGLFPTAFLTGNLFNQHIYWGIAVGGMNLGTVFIIGVLAWGVIQGMVALYFANRLVPRDWNHPRMGIEGWILVIIYQVVIMIIASMNPVTPHGSLLGYIVLGFLVVVFIVLFIKSLKILNTQPYDFKKSKVMDFLAFGSVVVFLILGTFFISGDVIVTSQPLNELAVRIENIWVFFCGIVFFTYRFWNKSDITV